MNTSNLSVWGFLTVAVLTIENVILIAGCAYLVGWHDWSAWWFVVAFLLCNTQIKVGKVGAKNEMDS